MSKLRIVSKPASSREKTSSAEMSSWQLTVKGLQGNAVFLEVTNPQVSAGTIILVHGRLDVLFIYQLYQCTLIAHNIVENLYDNNMDVATQN